MTAFREFEREVVRLLIGPRLELRRVTDVLGEAELVSCENSGVGYFLTVRHPSLPTERMVFNEPRVTGSVGDLHCGFLVFLENRELVLECHSWDGSVLLEDIRDRKVRIERAP